MSPEEKLARKKEYDRNYYLLHKEERKAYMKKYMDEHREEQRERVRLNNPRRVRTANGLVCMARTAEEARLIRKYGKQLEEEHRQEVRNHDES